MNLANLKVFLLVGLICSASLSFAFKSEVLAQLHEENGRWLNSEKGNVFGDSDINPMADPDINPMADPDINPMGDAYMRNDGSMGLRSEDAFDPNFSDSENFY
jgi:hypothetical protein